MEFVISGTGGGLDGKSLLATPYSWASGGSLNGPRVPGVYTLHITLSNGQILNVTPNKITLN